MRSEFLIYKNSGDGMLHARFIINKVDNVKIINKPAALCMEYKKVRLFNT
jgi:hypothetical protein